MSRLDEAGVRRDLKTGIFHSVYVIYGEEQYLKQQYALKLAHAIAGGPMESFNLQRFDGESLKMDQLTAAVEQLPVMASRKCVLVRDYSADQTAENKRLIALIQDLPEECVFILWCDTVEIPAKKPGKWKNILAAADQKGAVVPLSFRDETALSRVVCDRVRKLGSQISPEVARYLIRSCGRDLNVLLGEVEKLSAFRMGEPITEADVDLLAVKTVEANVFQLSKWIWNGNAKRALALLHDLLLQRTDPIQILGALSGSYVDLYRAKAAVSAGLRATDIASEFGYRGTEFRLRNASSTASSFSLSRLRSSLDVLLQADLQLKSSPADNALLLEQVVVRLLRLSRES